MGIFFNSRGISTGLSDLHFPKMLHKKINRYEYYRLIYKILLSIINSLRRINPFCPPPCTLLDMNKKNRQQ